MEFIEISSHGPNRNEEADLMRNRIYSLTHSELTHVLIPGKVREWKALKMRCDRTRELEVVGGEHEEDRHSPSESVQQNIPGQGEKRLHP